MNKIILKFVIFTFATLIVETEKDDKGLDPRCLNGSYHQ